MNNDDVFFKFPCSPREHLSNKENFLEFIRILATFLEKQNQVILRVFQATIRRLAALQRNDATRVHDITFLVRTYRSIKADIPMELWNGAIIHYKIYINGRTRPSTNIVEDVEPPSNEDTNRVFLNFPCSPQQFVNEKRKFLIFIRILSRYLEGHDRFILGVFQATIRKLASLQRNVVTQVSDITFLVRTYRAIKADVPVELWKGAMIYYNRFDEERTNTSRGNIVEGS